MKLTTVALIAAMFGCKKHDSANAQKIFARWEVGFRKSEPCILGKVGRNKDAATQAQLAQLFDERGDCPNWFSDGNHEIANVSALENERKRGEELSEAENAVNIFTELAPEDLTDEQAAAATELVDAVDNARLHWPAGVGELIAARDKLRAALGLPAASWEITQPTTVTDVKLQPAGKKSEPVSKWKVDQSTNPPTIVDDTGKKVFAFKRGTTYDMLPDPQSPIAWQQDNDGASQNITVFQGTTKTDVRDVVWVGNADHRLDLLSGLNDPTWTWFAPGKPPSKPMKLTGVHKPDWACASDNALWVLTTTDDGPIVVRYDLDGTPSKPGAAKSGAGMTPTCDDTAVAYSYNQVICTKDHDCEVEPTRGLQTVLLDGHVLTLKGNTATELFAIHTSHGGERVFRPTGAGKARAGGLTIRDHKAVVTFTDGREAAIP